MQFDAYYAKLRVHVINYFWDFVSSNYPNITFLTMYKFGVKTGGILK